MEDLLHLRRAIRVPDAQAESLGGERWQREMVSLAGKAEVVAF